MSVEQLERQILQLSEEERRQFARWFYEHEAEVFPPAQAEAELSAEVMDELRRRRQELDSDPNPLIPLDQLERELGQRLA